MIRIVSISVITVVCLSFIHCSEKSIEPAKTVDLNQLVMLKVGQSVFVTSESLKIGFSEVSGDSRCPMNAYCFWPGIGEVNLWLLKPAMDTVFVTVGIIGTTSALDERDHVPADTLGYRIALMGLSPYPQSFDPIDQSEYLATIRIRKSDDSDGQDCGVIISDVPPAVIQLDRFHLESIEISGDILDVSVVYGGGCEEHCFWLFMSPAVFLESYPAQANLYLRHFANDDHCKALIHQTLSFDLGLIIELYNQHYGEIDSFIINVYDYFDDEPGDKLSATYVP